MLTDAQLDKLLETRAYDYPRTKAMRNFLKKEAPHRVTGLSIEPDGVFIYTDTEFWVDDGGAGTFREDSETKAIKWFNDVIHPAQPRKKNVAKKYFQLYDVANDYSLSPVPGKYQFGDLTHAKKGAQKIIDIWVSGMKSRAGALSDYRIKWTRAGSSGARPEAVNEWNGSIHNGELVYKIIERRKNPVKKKIAKKAKRKSNPERITADYLKKRISLLNDMLGRPQEAYTKKADGGLTGNRGHLFIDNAYGGVKVAEMAGGGTGENNISDGYVSKRELSHFINGMIATARLIDRKKRGINPAKKKARKKNPTKPDWIIAAINNGSDNVMFLHASNQWTNRAKAVRFTSKAYATKIAQTAANNEFITVGVVPENMLSTKIAAGFKKAKR